MATFERKVSGIFHEHPRLVRKIPTVIRQLFQESESEFKRRIRKAPEDEQPNELLKLYDILFIDFYFDELDDWFLSWVADHHAGQFSEDELKEMAAQAASHLDFYEVTEVFPGEGSHIKSLYTEKEYFLKDISSSYQLTVWDIALLRRYSMENISYATGSTSLFQPLDRQHILSEIKNAHDQYMDLFQDNDYAVFAKNRWDVFIQIEREIHKGYKEKEFFTPYGKLQFCDVRFKVNDLRAILHKMEDLEEFHFIEKNVKRIKKSRQIDRYIFDWLSVGLEKELSGIRINNKINGFILTTHQLDIHSRQMGIEGIGQFFIDKYLGRLETRSVELAEFAVEHFTKLFGSAIVFQRIIKKDMAKLLKDRKSKEPADHVKEPDLPIKDVLVDEIFMKMLDTKIPALNDLTPREARRDPQALPLLITWLKAIENMEERKRLHGESFFSVSKFQKELGIDY